MGFDSGETIAKDFVRKVRPKTVSDVVLTMRQNQFQAQLTGKIRNC